MKTCWQPLLCASFAMAMSFDANALTITPTNPALVPLTFTGPSGSQITDLVNGYLSSKYGDAPDLTYKQDSSGLEEATLASSYSTEFLSDASWTITPSGPALTGPVYLLVKDGNHSPYAYLFDLTSLWNGTEELVLSGFWPGQGSISHVSVYATDGGTTLMLLGIALVGFGAARRFLRVSLN